MVAILQLPKNSMRGPFVRVVVALACTAAFLLQVVTSEEDTRVQDVGKRADKLTAAAFSLEEKIDARLDPKRIRKAGSLKARVDALAGIGTLLQSFPESPFLNNNIFIINQNIHIAPQ